MEEEQPKLQASHQGDPDPTAEDDGPKRDGWVCLNKHTHPASTKCCSAECCMMCCGYCSPTGVAVLVAALVIALWVYHFIIMANYPSAWKIVVSIIIMLLVAFLAASVLYAYYMVIFTSPGYVPADPWKQRPRYVGRAPLRTEGELQQQQQQGEAQVPLPHPVYGNLNPLMDERPLAEQSRREGDGDAGHAGAAPGASALERHSPYAQTGGPSNSGAADSTVVEVGVPAKDKRLATASNAQGAEEEPMSTREGGSGSEGGSGNPYTVTQLDREGRLRYCVKCQQYKPDFAHHCGTCGRCVYYFDHHCSWINNCVGRNNFKLFTVFVQYGAIGCIASAGLSVIGLFAMDKHEIGKKIGWIAIPGVMLVLGLTLSLFRMQLCCQMRNGRTTLESIIHSEQRQRELRSVGGYFGSLKRKRKKTAEEKEQEKIEKAERVKTFNDELFGPNPKCPTCFLPIPVRTDNTAVPTASLLKEE